MPMRTTCETCGQKLANPVPIQEDQSKLIEHMLGEIEDSLDAKGRANDFIGSLRDQFDRSGYLSTKQVHALKNFYDRIDS
jgi:hypothetical protein